MPHDVWWLVAAKTSSVYLDILYAITNTDYFKYLIYCIDLYVWADLLHFVGRCRTRKGLSYIKFVGTKFIINWQFLGKFSLCSDQQIYITNMLFSKKSYYCKCCNLISYILLAMCLYLFLGIDSEDNVFSLAFFNYLRDILELMNKIPIFEGENKNLVDA